MMTHATSQPHPGLPRVGETLDGRFELRAVIGEGGMGSVFRAYDHHGAREVALKLLTPRYLGRPERELRFLREAELGRRAQHRHLAQYLDAGRLTHAGWPFVTMEIIEGKELGRQLARGALPLHLAVRVARQIAGAVLALHRVGVVHRDVTPMNVLMYGDEAVLIDLSHAGDTAAPQLAVGQAGRLTQPHEVPGTHYYMPREQAQAAPAHPAMDVYAFGMTLVEMVTGRAPAGWDRETFIAMQREGKFTPPRVDVRIHPDVPAELAELAHACTKPEPAERPTMDEIVRRLDEVIAGLAMRATAADRVDVARTGAHGLQARPANATGLASPPRLDREPSQTHDAPRRRVWPALVLVVLGVVVGGWAAWSRDERTADAAAGSAPAPLLPQPPEVEVVAPATPVGDTTEVVELGQRAGVEPQPPPSTPRAPAKPRPADTEACARVREQAMQAVTGYEWSQAVALASRAQCWRSETARKRILVQGLFHASKWAECVRAGRNSKDAEVKRWVDFCKRHTG
jgi:eukaryotic-like serine/threonine-protein kinase